MGTAVDCGNRGVSALGSSLVYLCTSASQGGKIILLLGHTDNQPVPFRVDGESRFISVVHARMSPRSAPRDHLFWIVLMSIFHRCVPLGFVRAAITRSTPWIKAMAEADFVGDVRGGDSFSDIYGMWGFVEGFFMAWTVILIRGSMVQFPQTYGPYKSPVARWLARFLLKRSRVIIARDKASRKVAQDLVGSDQEVLLSPDVAFSLEAIRPERIALEPALSGPMPGGVIGLNVNGLMVHGGYTRNNMFGLKLDYATFLPALITALLSEHTGELWLIPHTYAPQGNVESDNEASEKLRDSLPSELRSRVRLIAAEYDQHELKGIIGQCGFFVGSRMHACIAALSQGVPCVGVAYSMKFAGVFESVGMEEWVVDARVSANEEAVARIVSLYRQRDGVREELSRRADEARQQLTGIFHGLVDELVPGRDRETSPREAIQQVVLP
jgi:polysaccharide pyruvyl transferase WcaK-like protein